MKFTPLFFFAIASAVDEVDDATLLQLRAANVQNLTHSTESKQEVDCMAMYNDELAVSLDCMAKSSMRSDSISNYYQEYHGVDRPTYGTMWANIARDEALKKVKATGVCDPIADMGMDDEEVDFIAWKATRAVKHIVDLYIEVLESPQNDQFVLSHFGSDRLAEMWESATHVFQEICQSSSTDLMEIKQGCIQHTNLDAFLQHIKAETDQDGVHTCAQQTSSALFQHRNVRHHRNHRRAQLVQILHTRENKLAEHFHKHLKYGGSERNMEILIAHAALGDLTPRQRQLLLHLDSKIPQEELKGTCDKWSDQREGYHHDDNLKNNVLLNNVVYRSYMDCICGHDEPKVVCQGAFLRDSNSVKKAIQDRQGELLAESGAESHQLVASTDLSNTTSDAVPAGIGPCLLSDAFSCEVCLSSYCVPFASRPRKTGQKNTNQEGGPFVVVKNALTAKATDFKISCTACASLHPGEQISFEVEMYASTNFASIDSMFVNTKIGIDAKTCIGPGSPLRVIFDTLGINACKSNFKAEYRPFLGDLDVEGAIPGIVTGTWFEATFGTRIHDPPGAVRLYCTDRSSTRIEYTPPPGRRRRWIGSWRLVPYTVNGFDQACYDGYKNQAGPLMFSAACTVPLLITNHKFEMVKVSGPHTSGSRWQVELFQIPFEDVAQAIKDLWDNHVGPAMENALNDVGEGITAAGEWTVGAANSVGDWSVGAVDTVGGALNDAGDWTAGAADTVVQSAPVQAVVSSPPVQAVANFVSSIGFR